MEDSGSVVKTHSHTSTYPERLRIRSILPVALDYAALFTEVYIYDESAVMYALFIHIDTSNTLSGVALVHTSHTDLSFQPCMAGS